MSNIVHINKLAENLNKYDYLEVWVNGGRLHILNLNINKELILFNKPIGRTWGFIINKNNDHTLYVLKPQFDRALKHLYRIANEIKQKKS